jgi:hypothetical protein
MASNHWPIFSPLQTYGVGLFLHQQGLDTTTSAGKARRWLSLAGKNNNFAETHSAFSVHRYERGGVRTSAAIR